MEAIAKVETVANTVDIDRLARARALHRKVCELRDTVQQKWFVLANDLHIIKEEKLFKELGYKNWGGYIDATFKMPAQTLNNYLMPHRKLLEAGVDPAEVADVPLSNVNELAVIAKANGGVLDPALVEKAKERRSKKQVREFKEAVAAERARLGIEGVRQIPALICQESLFKLWQDGLNVAAEMSEDNEILMPRHHQLLMEWALVAFLQSPDVLRILNKLDEKSGKNK